MTVNAFLSPTTRSKFWSNTGQPLAFGKLYTYAAGTVIPAATYVDSTQTTQNTNPITLDFRGECSLFLPPNIAFKYLLTDSAGTVIPGWPVDQIVISQLITLYGGVDTGVTNAYVLNFTANFTSLTDGIVVYWIASNNSAGPSTLNVNGLGVVPLVQQNGNALTFGAIQSNTVTQVMYKGGNWLLLTAASTIPQSGTVSLTPTGCTTAPAQACTFTVSGTTCNLTIPYFKLTSNSTSFTLTGLPSYLQPASMPQQLALQYAINTTNITTAEANVSPGSGTIVLSTSVSDGPNMWTSSSSKGLGYLNTFNFFQYGNTITYSLL